MIDDDKEMDNEVPEEPGVDEVDEDPQNLSEKENQEDTSENEYHFVPEDELTIIIKNILLEEREIGSLRQLTNAVNTELRDSGHKHLTTSARIRNIIIKNNLAEIQVNGNVQVLW